MRWQDGTWVDEGMVPGIDDDVREMAQTPDGVLWAGTPSRGILRIDLGPQGRGPMAEARVTRFAGGQGLPEDPGWTSAHLADNGALYFRTNAGLFTFDDAAQRFLPFPHFGRRFCDGTLLVSRSASQSNGVVWASVYPLHDELFPSPWGRGVFGRAIPNARRRLRLDSAPAAALLPDRNLSALLVEENASGRVVWVGVESGLVRFDPDRYPAAEKRRCRS